MRITHQHPSGREWWREGPTSRELSRPSSAPKVVYFGIPGVILSVLRGLYERVAARYIDCVGMAAG